MYIKILEILMSTDTCKRNNEIRRSSFGNHYMIQTRECQ